MLNVFCGRGLKRLRAIEVGLHKPKKLTMKEDGGRCLSMLSSDCYIVLRL